MKKQTKIKGIIAGILIPSTIITSTIFAYQKRDALKYVFSNQPLLTQKDVDNAYNKGLLESETTLDSLKNQLNALKNTADKLQIENERLLSMMNSTDSELREQLIELQTTIDENRVIISNYETQVAELENVKANLQESLQLSDANVVELTNKKQELELKIEDLTNSVNMKQSEINSLKIQLEETYQEIWQNGYDSGYQKGYTDGYDEKDADSSISTLSTWDGSVDTSWYTDASTTTYSSYYNAFLIYNADQFAGIAKLVNDGTTSFENETIMLMCDVDFNHLDWTPIGYFELNDESIETTRTFKGNFDGNYHTLHNFAMNDNHSYEFNEYSIHESQGLFYKLGNQNQTTYFKNLFLNNTENSTFNASHASLIGVVEGIVNMSNIKIYGNQQFIDIDDVTQNSYGLFISRITGSLSLDSFTCYQSIEFKGAGSIVVGTVSGKITITNSYIKSNVTFKNTTDNVRNSLYVGQIINNGTAILKNIIIYDIYTVPTSAHAGNLIGYLLNGTAKLSDIISFNNLESIALQSSSNTALTEENIYKFYEQSPSDILTKTYLTDSTQFTSIYDFTQKWEIDTVSNLPILKFESLIKETK